MDTLDRLNELHRFYDGPFPRDLIVGVRAAQLQQAESQIVFFIGLCRSQQEVIWGRKRDGSLRPSMRADLRLYRRKLNHWLKVKRRLLRCKP